MEGGRLAESSPELHVPHELCRAILSRLPVKSLLRFRCVSKPWLSLIDDPDFRRLHLESFKNNLDETHLLAAQIRDGRREFVVRCSATFETTSETLESPLRCRDWDIVCSVDGLVLLKRLRAVDDGLRTVDDVMIWNPSIRESHEIPPLPGFEAFSGIEAVIGIGYGELVKDYKCVKLIYDDSVVLHSVAVYTLGVGSWKVSTLEGKGCSNMDSEMIYRFIDSVYLRGSLYFLAFNKEKGTVDLIWFDLSSEVFCSISVPDGIADGNGLQCLRLFRYGCSSVALIDFVEDWTAAMMCVWDSQTKCWTEPCSLLKDLDDILYLKKNLDLLIWFPHEVATGHGFKQFEFVSLVSAFNLETKKEKILLPPEEGKSLSGFNGVYGYIESFVLLK